MKTIFSHPTGNSNVRAAAEGFMEAGMLAGFYTTIASFPGTVLDNLGSFKFLSEVRRRRYTSILKPVTRLRPWREAGRLVASRGGISKLVVHEKGPFCIDAVYRDLDFYVARNLKKSHNPSLGMVYAYEDGAASSFREAKSLGLQCFYDLPTGYWRAARRLLENERERWPEWVSTMTGFQDSCSKLERKDEELCLADRIIVASHFTAKTLEEYPGKLAPIDIIPYGFPPIHRGRVYPPLKGMRLKLLFVGKLTQQKGIADLFAALKKLESHVELTIVGMKPSANCAALDKALAGHRWIPSLHHAGILSIMREHDVLVFPSLFDGFGLVITEAMSQGTPVIASDRSAGPDLISHGCNGWVVNAGSISSLQLAMEELLYKPELITEVGQEALKTASNRPWEIYKAELVKKVLEHFGRLK